MKQKIRIILADDQELFRLGFKAVLDTELDGLEVIGDATNGRELVELVKKEEPDLVITDIEMPEMDGIEACRQLQEVAPLLPVIALSIHKQDHFIVDMLEAGAKGYLLKNATRHEIREAIRIVHGGGTYISKATSYSLAALLAKSKADLFRLQDQPRFNDNEKKIIQLICQEFSSKQIAHQLKLTTRTVEFYRTEIQKKIGARNMAGIVVYALRNGLYK